ncbi:MAG: alpha-2-macroglobulin [Aureispira sp.]|nr:alpha-2-macroglobulin [Aureispira sp.]
MRILIWILAFVLLGQTTMFAQKNKKAPYEKQWKTIDSLERKGLPKSALKETEKLLKKIKSQSKKDYYAPQYVKALIHYNKYQSRLEERGVEFAIYRFKDAYESEKDPLLKSILGSLLAEGYTKYLENNYYKVSQRTPVEGMTTDSIHFWDMEMFTTTIFELYQASIAQEQIKTTPIEQFKAITAGGVYNKGLRPTVYDFLVHRAIDFFSNTRYYLTKPVYEFYIQEPAMHGNLKEFLGATYKTKDSLAVRYWALVLFQDALKFHEKDKDPAGLIDLDLKRLRFVRNNSILSNKDELFFEQMQRIEKDYSKSPASAEASYEIAQNYYNQSSYDPKDKENPKRWDRKKAYEYCAKIISKFPGSYGAKKCEALQSQIRAKSMNLMTASIEPINKPILAKLDYRNVSKLYFRLLEVDDEKLAIFNKKRTSAEKIKYLGSMRPIKKWDLTVEDGGDYHAHSTELMVPGQSTGQYMLVVSEDKRFKHDNNGVTYIHFRVSNIAYTSRKQKYKGYTEFNVVDRMTGQPLEGVRCEFWVSRYNSSKRAYEYIKAGETTSDKDGYLTSESVSAADYNSRNLYPRFFYKKDYLDTKNSFFNYKYDRNERISYQTTFFLDRAIYRPGQTVYFKGLLVAYHPDGRREIVTNESVSVALYDANYQEVNRMTLTTNEYGTYNAKFVAPAKGMLGSMRIQSSYGGNTSNKYFRVEEYKRPKFEAKFNPVTGAFKLDDSVTVTGIAQAYAGNNVDGAKVKYRVVRQVRFPYWNWWRWGYNPYSTPDKEIGFGETVTDEKGEFKVSFKAEADKNLPADRKPQFNYTVYADIVDITGETHSTQVYVSVGYITLSTDIRVSGNVERNSAKPFKIKTTNLNGEFEAAKGTVVIEQLKTPEVPYVSRYWSAPDMVTISEADFKKWFPTIPYGTEDDYKNWPIVKTTLSSDFDTEKSKELTIADLKSWPQGKYKLTLKTQDKYGEKIELQKYFTLFDKKAKEVPLNQALFVAKTSLKGEPGDTVYVDLGSINKDAELLVEFERDNEIIGKQWVKSEGRQRIPFVIEEKHRGGVAFHIMNAQHNRFFSTNGNITVPWSNKDLKIEYSSFRNKLLPGQEEEWQVKISGPKGDKVAAEVVASMYDASLDVFASNYWSRVSWPNNYGRLYWQGNNCFRSSYANSINHDNWWEKTYAPSRSYKYLQWFGFAFYDYYGYYGDKMVARSSSNEVMMDGDKMEEMEEDMAPMAEPDPQPTEAPTATAKVARKESAKKNQTITDPEPTTKPEGDAEDFSEVKVRTNLNETVFFMPDLMTDAEGNVIIKFTMNEALTRWKFMLFAHTKDLKTMTSTKEVVTQKDLMIMPNVPRFLRQNDEIELTAKVSNMTEELMKGQAILKIFDAVTMKPVDVDFGNSKATLNFEAKSKQSAPLSWKIKVPDTWTNTLSYQVIAKSGDFSDGEENGLPVLTNRMLVTETMPLPVRAKQKRKFTFKRMAEVSKSPTMRQHKLTLEFTPNPAWYAVQALPYLMEYPYECTEQVFSRFYANSLATSVVNSHPKVKEVFEKWKTVDKDAMLSNLSKNQELKSALLEETPWVMQAQSEEQQKQNIGVLFDMTRMSKELADARDKMADRQLSNGGFSWFPGGQDSWYVTQYLVEGMGHLDKLGARDKDNKIMVMMARALGYIDQELADHYTRLLEYAAKQKDKEKYLAEDHLDGMVMHYLYARSFYPEAGIENTITKEAIAYYEAQAVKYWLNKGIYMQGMLALTMHRKGEDKVTPTAIVKSLKEKALNHSEMGMYWKYPSGYFWYQLPIETHALMIEVFHEVAKDDKAVEDLKTWLLKAKQTTHWKTTKATAASCYALLMTGNNLLAEDKEVFIKMGKTKLDQSQIKKEAGTGYFKKTWEADEITPDMATITIKNPNNVVSWGALYWQYFEDMDKITHFKETPLKLNKKVFKKVNTLKGPVLKAIDAKDVSLEPGDLLTVRIELKVDRDMEYVHMKDTRASGFEPENTLSQYKYQGGLGYYESTRDASTNFFISYLSKGTYVFEYPLRVNHKGDFSNGVTTIQCMYAPEFTSHSEGIRVQVK